mmetsp:Transcript_28764/g.84854  ORF Transcript_28764/g.84854 Transcript_28764/m.84854 type:complete len:100 (-) Transcript_28764:749-1048(-)
MFAAAPITTSDAAKSPAQYVRRADRDLISPATSTWYTLRRNDTDMIIEEMKPAQLIVVYFSLIRKASCNVPCCDEFASSLHTETHTIFWYGKAKKTHLK